MAKKNDKKSVVNVKIEKEVKSNLDTLVFMKKTNIQDFCEQLILDAIDKESKKIAEIEKLRE